jgi:hypothetical protein
MPRMPIFLRRLLDRARKARQNKSISKLTHHVYSNGHPKVALCRINSAHLEFRVKSGINQVRLAAGNFLE